MTDRKEKRVVAKAEAVARRPEKWVPSPEVAPQLDQVIHERLRLGMVSALAVNETLSFVDLKRVLNTSDGNLSVHARKLEDAGYVCCNKFFQGRTPRTEYSLTAAGKKALEKYLEQMEAIIRGARKS
ncbi:MAG TPA: transcriptional regulator [Anaerolineaceae bacterium]